MIEGVDRAWFENLFGGQRGWVAELARIAGVDSPTMSRSLKGERRFKDVELERIARHKKVPVEEVHRHAGYEGRRGSPPEIRLSATIDATGKVERLKASGSLPPPTRARAEAAVIGHRGTLSAAQVRAGKGALKLWDDAVLVFEESDHIEPTAVGVLSIVRLTDGVRMVGKLDKARKTGEATIHTADGETRQVTIDQASPVLAVVP
jgi:hypothetical protein